jgi:predicted metalloprotease
MGFPMPGGGGGFPIKAGGGILGIVVALAAVFLPQLLGGASAPTMGVGAPELPAAADGRQQGAGEEGTVLCTTEIEQVVCGATDDIHLFWEGAFPQQFQQEYVPTSTVFFSQATNTGCGQASAQTGPFYCPIDSLVYFDLEFLAALQQQLGAEGDLAAQYIVAHEYGHHVQNVLGINAQVHQAQQQNPSQADRYSVALELQADCLAGVWAHDANARGLLAEGELAEAINAAEAVGDDRIQQQTQGRIDPESWTHGSSEQRQTWFRRGYESGSANSCDTFAE